jgi:hypothetical protein
LTGCIDSNDPIPRRGNSLAVTQYRERDVNETEEFALQHSALRTGGKDSVPVHTQVIWPKRIEQYANQWGYQITH